MPFCTNIENTLHSSLATAQHYGPFQSVVRLLEDTLCCSVPHNQSRLILVFTRKTGNIHLLTSIRKTVHQKFLQEFHGIGGDSRVPHDGQNKMSSCNQKRLQASLVEIQVGVLLVSESLGYGSGLNPDCRGFCNCSLCL